jgi:hypothetical protein
VGDNSGHISQDKVGTNPKEKFLCECCYHLLLLEVVLYGSVQSVQQGEGMIFEAACWHGNQGCLECFLAVVGLYCSDCTTDCGHGFLGIVLERVVQLYGFGTNFKEEIVGDSFGVVRYFLLDGNCEFVVDMYFPKVE